MTGIETKTTKNSVGLGAFNTL